MIEYEIVTHDRINGVRMLVNTIHIRSIHMHHDTELLYAVEGRGSVIIKNKKYDMKVGDLVLINAYESHEIISEDDRFTLIIIQFSGHFLQDYCNLRNILFLNAYPRPVIPEAEYQVLQDNIRDFAFAYLKQEEFFKLTLVSRLADILNLLLRFTDTEILGESEYSRRRKNEKRMQRINEYIEANYQDQIRLSDIAEKENLTVTHLSHLIREQLGVSFQDYLRHKRLESAVRMINSDRTLCEISDLCGFSELKYMTKAFQETFHMTPAEYRRNKIGVSMHRASEDRSEYIYSDEEALRLLNDLFGRQ